MSLLTLSPEATRLRRVAKAHAAGEISQREYRAARRQVINKFAVAVSRVPAYGSDDTVPRFDLETTLRRQEGFAEPAEVVQRQSWLMWLCLSVVLGIAVWLPLMSQAATISAVSERDPNPSTAPTFNVDQVQWIVPEDLHEQLAQTAQELLATGLQQLKAENSPLQHGFSEAELTEVGRFLNAIGVHDEAVSLSAGDLQDLKALVAAQKSKRGVSLPQLEQLAVQLQSWLRDQGYPLATAYIPAQEVVNDTVQFDVAFGLLSGIRVADQASARLQTRFSDLLGKRVQTQAIETRLNTLNRQLGVQSEVYFQPGVEVGESEMVLQVKQHRQLGASIGVDNYGVEALGQERIVMQGRWNSPRGTGDVLSAKAFSTLENTAHRFLQVGYEAPVMGGQFDAAAHLSYADLQLDSGSAFSGEGVLLDTNLTDTQIFTRTHRREFVYSAGYHQFNWQDIADQQTWFVAAALDGHRLWDNQKIALQGTVKALVGGLDDTRPGQDQSYWRLSGEMNAWMPLEPAFYLGSSPRQAQACVGCAMATERL